MKKMKQAAVFFCAGMAFSVLASANPIFKSLIGDSDTVHTTHFQINGTDPLTLDFKIGVGTWTGSECDVQLKDLGQAPIPNNSSVSISSKGITSMFGTSPYGCMKEQFTNVNNGVTQTDSFQLTWSGSEYTGSTPSDGTVRF